MELLKKLMERWQGAFTWDERMRSLHGVGVGDICPCGTPVAEPADGRVPHACLVCGRPFPARCYGSLEDPDRACWTFIQPQRSGDGWTVAGQCAGCATTDRTANATRSAVLFGVPDWAVKLPVLKHPQRAKLLQALRTWASGLGKPALYVHGSTGTGKTVAAAHAVVDGLSGGFIRGSVLWAREHDLVWRARTVYHDPESRQALDRARDADWLVIDEAFAEGARAWTDHVAYELGELLCRRFEERRRTLLLSNDRLDFARVASSRLASRFAEVGEAIEVLGKDLRLEAGHA